MITTLLRAFTRRPPTLKYFSSSPSLIDNLEAELNALAPEISTSLHSNGYWSNSSPLLSPSEIQSMRSESILLRSIGRFEQSYSESIDSSGVATRFDKDGVFACEPDGGDYDSAPDLLTYMSTVITKLPPLLNDSSPKSYEISNKAFNAKLAVTSSGGSGYPKHIDNPQGLAVGDTRKLTVILYLNPAYEEPHGGNLLLYLADDEVVSVTPSGGRLVLFWSDQIPHSVTKTSLEHIGEEYDRYALTIWLPTDDAGNIHDPESPFNGLKV